MAGKENAGCSARSEPARAVRGKAEVAAAEVGTAVAAEVPVVAAAVLAMVVAAAVQDGAEGEWEDMQVGEVMRVVMVAAVPASAARKGEL